MISQVYQEIRLGDLFQRPDYSKLDQKRLRNRPVTNCVRVAFPLVIIDSNALRTGSSSLVSTSRKAVDLFYKPFPECNRQEDK